MRRRGGLGTVASLLLLCLFCACVLAVLTAGSGAYQGVVRRMERQYAERTCLSYIGTKVRHFDRSGGVEIGWLDGISALALREAGYVTWIYCFDGSVRELYTEDGLSLPPEAGEIVAEASSLTFTLTEPGLLRVTWVGTDGQSAYSLLALRSEEPS